MIRVAREEDANVLREIYGYYVENTAVSFEYTKPTREDFAGRIANILKTYPYLVYEENGEVLGYAYAHPLIARKACDWSVEASIYIRRDARGKGIGKALYMALENTLRLQNIVNVEVSIAATDGENPYLTDDSLRFHAKMGYRQIGVFTNCGYKFGRWYHLVWMEKQLAPHRKDQPAMIPFTQIREKLSL